MKLALVIWNVCWLGTCFAQQNFVQKLFKPAQLDTNFVISYYDHHLHITGVAIRHGSQLSLINRQTAELSVYEPNSVHRFGFGVDYNFLTFEYSRAFEVIEAPNPDKGITQTTALRAGITGRKFMLSSMYYQLQGMYLANLNEFNLHSSTPQTEGYVKRGDIAITSLYASLYYFFNHTTFSTVASLWQIDRQKKSAGSFTTGVTAYAVSVSADSVINFNPLPTEYKGIREHQNTIVGINGGYAHNFVWKKRFFINFFLIPGINLQFGNELLGNGVRVNYRNHLGVHSDARFILGYNGDRNYFGVNSSSFILFGTFNPDIALDLAQTYFRVFYGHRVYLPLRKR